MAIPNLTDDATQRATRPQPIDDTTKAATFWIERARKTPPMEAVHPRTRFIGFAVWTRRMLQRWTIDRIARDRPRFKRGVDIGCGPGDWAELYKQHCDELYACDIAPAFVEQTRARLAGTRSHVECSDLRSYGVPVGADLVTLGAVLIYLDDDDVIALMRRIYAAMEPGGLVVVRDWCTFNFGRPSRQSKIGFSIHRRPRDLQRLIMRTGFTPLELRASPSIYAEVMGGGLLQWPLRALWCLVSLPWHRASHTLLFRR